MDWANILAGASDGAALALTVVGLVFGYRAVTIAVRDENLPADLQRQVNFGIVAVLAVLLAVGLFALGRLVS